LVQEQATKRKRGRPAIPDTVIDQIADDLCDGHSVRATAKRCGVGHCTVQSVRNMLRELGEFDDTIVGDPLTTPSAD
jgi:hypothetical protein